MRQGVILFLYISGCKNLVGEAVYVFGMTLDMIKILFCY